MSVCRAQVEGATLKACSIFRDSLIKQDLQKVLSEYHWEFVHHVISVISYFDSEAMKKIAMLSREEMFIITAEDTYTGEKRVAKMCNYEKHGDIRYCRSCPVGRIAVDAMENDYRRENQTEFKL